MHSLLPTAFVALAVGLSVGIKHIVLHFFITELKHIMNNPVLSASFLWFSIIWTLLLDIPFPTP
jgi:hypothetical protein